MEDQSGKTARRKDHIVRTLVLIGIAWAVLTGSGAATEPINKINDYDAGRLHDLADQIAAQTRESMGKAEVFQMVGQVQMDFLRILIRQNDEIIRQNDEAIRQNGETIRQNEEIIQLLRKIGENHPEKAGVP